MWDSSRCLGQCRRSYSPLPAEVVFVAIRHTMWSCRRESSLGAVGMVLLIRLLPAMACRSFAKIAFRRIAKKRRRPVVICGRTVEFSRSRGRSSVSSIGGLSNAAHASLSAKSLSCMLGWDGIKRDGIKLNAYEGAAEPY